jgi:hypothetical protein
MDSAIASKQTVVSGTKKLLARVGRPSDIGSSVGWASVTPPSGKDDTRNRALTDVIPVYPRGLSITQPLAIAQEPLLSVRSARCEDLPYFHRAMTVPQRDRTLSALLHIGKDVSSSLFTGICFARDVAARTTTRMAAHFAPGRTSRGTEKKSGSHTVVRAFCESPALLP